jgi:hypothetical protein
MAPVKKKVEKEGGKKKKMITVEVTNDCIGSNSKRLWRSRLRRKRKKTETSLSSNEIRQDAKARVNRQQ